MALNQEALDAKDRLENKYNGNAYNAETNSGGMAAGGSRTNYIPAIRDVATVAEAIANETEAAATNATNSASSASSASASASAAASSETNAETSATNAAASAGSVNLPNEPVNATYLKYNSTTGEYEPKTVAEVASDVGLPASATADTYIKRNAENTAYITKTTAEVASDVAGGLADDAIAATKIARETTITDDDSKIPTSGAVIDCVNGEISPELKAYSETTFNNTGTGGTQTIDVSKGNKQKITIATSTTTLAFTGWAESGKHSGVVLDIIDGGSQTLILPTQTKLVGDETPDFTPSGRDRFVFTSEDAGTNIDMYVVGLDIK